MYLFFIRRNDPEYFWGRKHFSRRNRNRRRDAVPPTRRRIIIVHRRRPECPFVLSLRSVNLRTDSSSSSSSSVLAVIVIDPDEARLSVVEVHVIDVVVEFVVATDAKDEFHAACSTNAAVEILQALFESRRRRSQVIIVARLKLQAWRRWERIGPSRGWKVTRPYTRPPVADGWAGAFSHFSTRA